MNESQEQEGSNKQSSFKEPSFLNEQQITSKANNFFDSIKNEELPTPKKGH